MDAVLVRKNHMCATFKSHIIVVVIVFVVLRCAAIFLLWFDFDFNAFYTILELISIQYRNFKLLILIENEFFLFVLVVCFGTVWFNSVEIQLHIVAIHTYTHINTSRTDKMSQMRQQNKI